MQVDQKLKKEMVKENSEQEEKKKTNKQTTTVCRNSLIQFSNLSKYVWKSGFVGDWHSSNALSAAQNINGFSIPKKISCEKKPTLHIAKLTI